VDDVDAIIAALGLRPHPEGGVFAETWRGGGDPGQRASGSAIYYLLRRGEVSAWHRIDATEVWHHYAGAPLRLSLAASSGDEAALELVLGLDVLAGQRPQIDVPAGDWQSAVSLGDWTLVGCTVSPAFTHEGFEMAPPGWEPGAGHDAPVPADDRTR
jgi:predicted cupin superfamily sugar epimerase